MIYQGIKSQKHGDEIMVLQENIIVFKGFLRPEGIYLNMKFYLKSIDFYFLVKKHLHLN